MCCASPPHFGASAQQRRDGHRFEPLVGRATAGHLAAKSGALPRLDQRSGKLARVEVGPNGGVVLAGTHACGQGNDPTIEDAGELVTHRVTRPTEFERQVADQAPEKEVTGLVFVGELVEETRDPLLRRILRLEDGQQPLLDVGQ